jgi:Amt family ammonium transporter
MKFSAYLIFSGIVTGLIYPIFGGWVWNANGWLAQLGVVDFAGCLVVHSVGAWCSLAALLVLGPRLGRFSLTGEVRDIPGHNLTLVALGAFILWIGWFGFNGGSIKNLSTDNLGLIILNTHLGGCAGALGAMALMAVQKKPILMTVSINGSIAGLVSITAGAVHFSPLASIAVGFLGGIFYSLGAVALLRFKIDDVVDAIAVHGVGGTWGVLAVALFPQHEFSLHSLLIQCVGVIVAFLWTFPLSYLCFKGLDMYWGVRASTLHEQRGLDYTEHFELGYPEFQKSLIANPVKDKGYE